MGRNFKEIRMNYVILIFLSLSAFAGGPKRVVQLPQGKALCLMDARKNPEALAAQQKACQKPSLVKPKVAPAIPKPKIKH